MRPLKNEPLSGCGQPASFCPCECVVEAHTLRSSYHRIGLGGLPIELGWLEMHASETANQAEVLAAREPSRRHHPIGD